MHLNLLDGRAARLAAALPALAALCLAVAGPAEASSTLAQKQGPAACLGPGAPCALGLGLDGVRSVRVSPDGRNAYAVAALGSALTTFDRAADGTLKQKGATAGCISALNSPLDPASCARATGLEGSAGVSLSPDGRNVYVASQLSDAVAVFDRAADGTLAQKPGLAGCVSDGGAGPCASGEGLVGASAVTVSPDGRSVYIASSDSSSVAVFDRAADGALTQKAGLAGCIANPDTPPCAEGRALDGVTGLAVSADGASVYVASGGGVAVLDRAADGALTQKAGVAGCFSETGSDGSCAAGKALNGPTSVAVSPDGVSVYVSAAGSSAVAVFDRLPGGALMPKPGAAACISGVDSAGACTTVRALAEADSVTVSPDGASVYVTSRTDANGPGGLLTEGDGFIAIFDRSADGALTQPAGAAGCVSETGSDGACIEGTAVRGPVAMAVSPDGRNAYAGALGADGAIAVFDRVPVTAGPLLPRASVDATRPVLRLSLAPARFKAAVRGASVVKRGGARVSYRLSEPAAVRFTVEQVVAGRRSGGRCVASRPSNRSAKRCDRYRALAGSFAHTGAKGANALRFSGRLRGRKLGRGRYRLRAVATDAAANRSPAQLARFAIVRR